MRAAGQARRGFAARLSLRRLLLAGVLARAGRGSAQITAGFRPPGAGRRPRPGAARCAMAAATPAIASMPDAAAAAMLGTLRQSA